MSNPMYAGNAAIWAQRYGAGQQPEYLGCHDLMDWEIPLGDVTLIRCPDPRETGKWIVKGSYQGEPGVPSVVINTLMTGISDYLEDWPCRGNIIVNKQECGRRDLLANWKRRLVLYGALKTSEGGGALAARQQSDEAESTQAFTFAPMDILKIVQMAGGVQSIAATAQLSSLANCSSARCAGVCGAAQLPCDVMWAGSKFIAGSTLDKADVWYTIDGGITWSATAAQPFAAAEDINAIICVQLDNTTTRIIVMRGTTDAGNGPEIAYSDDSGATWTVVEIDATHALYGLGPQSLFALDAYHIWAVTDSGHICFSDDAGVTWTVQNAGTLVATDLYGIMFVNAQVGYVVGENGVVARSVDGGASWSLLTTPAGIAADEVQALWVLSETDVWIGTSGGDLLHSQDAGVTWTLVTPPAATNIWNIAFYHPMVGYAAGATAGGKALWRTTDGGANWETMAVNALAVTIGQVVPCGLNSLVLAGGDTGDGVIIKYVEG